VHQSGRLDQLKVPVMKANVPVVVIFIVLIESSDSPASSDEALPPGIIFDYLLVV